MENIDHKNKGFEFRFWNKVLMGKPQECWNWKKGKSKGHPQVRRGDKNYYASRIAYELIRGAIPEGMNVLHQCDNPRCVNPDHLFLGTQKVNIRDAIKKGRLHNFGMFFEFDHSTKVHLKKMANDSNLTMKGLLESLIYHEWENRTLT